MRRCFVTCARTAPILAESNPITDFQLLLNAVAARAKAHPVAYGHWYIDGGQPADHSPLLTCVSYRGAGTRARGVAAQHPDRTAASRHGAGGTAHSLARLVPSDLGLDKAGDEVLDRFQVKLLTEGSGTQIFSTTFAQWTAREALRRAQPLTVMVRFAPRQRQRPMNELLTSVHANAELDLAGSLVDADMGAYYNWLNQQRLPGADQSAFLVWFEGHNQALAIGPSIPRGTVSTTVADLANCSPWSSPEPVPTSIVSMTDGCPMFAKRTWAETRVARCFCDHPGVIEHWCNVENSSRGTAEFQTSPTRLKDVGSVTALSVTTLLLSSRAEP